MNIIIINGPNLNLLGKREPEKYGNITLDEINKKLSSIAEKLNHKINFFQSNSEGVLIDVIHQAYHDNIDYIIFNPAAYTHTSIALRDALLAVDIPFIEVHLSNIYKRESFRHKSYFSDMAKGVVAGFGPESYEIALYAADKNK